MRVCTKCTNCTNFISYLKVPVHMNPHATKPHWSNMQKLGAVGALGAKLENIVISLDIPANNLAPTLHRAAPTCTDTGRALESNSEPSTMRERRKLVKLTTKIERWWASLPMPARLQYFPLRHINEATGTSINNAGPALRSLGWLPTTSRIAGKPTRLWVPPEIVSLVRHDRQHYAQSTTSEDYQ